MKKANNWWKNTFSDTYFSLWDHKESSTPNTKKRKNNGLDVVDFLNLRKNAKVLDLACGPGRHSISLAQKGFDVTGIDYSSSALSIAKELATENNVKVSFLKKDMRNFNLNKKFDAVFLLGNSFGYFSDDENEKVINNISKHLKDNGFLVIHTINPVQILLADDKEKTYKQNISSGNLTMKLLSFDPLTFIRKSQWIVKKGNTKEILNISLRLYTAPEIKKILENNKLSIFKIFGSLNLKKYTQKSPSLIIVAKK